MREKIIDIILEVAMAHHDDISATDEANAAEAADKFITQIREELLGKLPKEMENADEELGYEIYHQKGWNDCLSQIQQIINNFCK